MAAYRDRHGVTAPERVCVTCGTVQPWTGRGCSACGASCFAMRPVMYRADTAEPVTPQAGIVGAEPDGNHSDTVSHV